MPLPQTRIGRMWWQAQITAQIIRHVAIARRWHRPQKTDKHTECPKTRNQITQDLDSIPQNRTVIHNVTSPQTGAYVTIFEFCAAPRRRRINGSANESLRYLGANGHHNALLRLLLMRITSHSCGPKTKHFPKTRFFTANLWQKPLTRAAGQRNPLGSPRMPPH